MKVFVSKEIQAFEYASFTELKNENESEFCCEKLQKYTSSVKSWNNKIGKFCIVENKTFVSIDYCPFCGQKIEYIQVE